MTRARRLSLLLAILGICNNCGTVEKVEDKYIDQGPIVTSCVVDMKNGGYQCGRIDQADPFFLSFSDAATMVCVSPMDLEDSLKACKKGEVLIVPLCTISNRLVACQDIEAKPVVKDLTEMDNFWCLNQVDRNRLLQRCNPRGY